MWILVLFCYLQIIQIILVKSEPELNLLGSIASTDTTSLYYDPRYSCLIFGDENGGNVIKKRNFFKGHSSKLDKSLLDLSPTDDPYKYYAASGNFGVTKIDTKLALNQDQNVIVEEEIDIGGSSTFLSINSNYIYTSNSNENIAIIGIDTNIGKPTIPISNSANLINLNRDGKTFLLCISDLTELNIIDVSDPLSFSIISTKTLGNGNSHKMIFSENKNLLYIANDRRGLIICNLDIIEQPEILPSSMVQRIVGFDIDIENNENLVFSVLGPYSNNEIEYFLTITDISDPNNLRLVLEKAFYPGEYRGLLYFSADYLFIATYRHGILVYEYKDQEYTQFILYIIIGVVGVGSSALILITYNKKKSSGKSSNTINPNYLSKNVKSSTPIVANPKNQPFNDDTYVDSFEKDLFINNKSRKSKAKDRESISSGLSIASEFSNKTKK